MGKYADAYSDIFSVFGNIAWKNENIVTYPENFTGDKVPEYIRVYVVSNPGNSGNRLNSVAGILLIDIFIPVGNGPARAAEIADKLDKYLAGKTITVSGGNTQFFSSSFVTYGVDKIDNTLYKAQYTIPFNFFGV